MDAVREQPSTSLLRRAFQWLGDFETALEMQPADHLELRVARLERRIAELTDDAPTAPSSRKA